MDKSKEKKKAKGDGNSDDGHHTPEKELAIVVLHAGEMGDVHYLKDYLEMTKLTGELNVNEQDSKGCTPLHFAVASKQIDIVKTLVQYGANVNLRDYMGFTPLFWATGRYANVKIANYLIDKGRASVHVTTETGACALHGAALQGNLDCVSLLLKFGADPCCTDNSGNTPLDLAKDSSTKSLLHKVLRHTNLAADEEKCVCAHCGGSPEGSELKRCGRCFVVKYCDRTCQIAHWKSSHRKTCTGFVVGRPVALPGKIGAAISHHTNRVFLNNIPSVNENIGVLKKKKFIVKVQLPLNVSNAAAEMAGGEMMVYNADRSVNGFIVSAEKGYAELRDLISKEGYMGIKAFFWAELILDADDGSFKVFHGQCSPYQDW